MLKAHLPKTDFHGILAKDLGGDPCPPEISALLDQYWPESFTSIKGHVVMPPENVASLEALYLLFGVPLKVAENSLEVLGYAYDIFNIGLGDAVSFKLRNPEKFEGQYRDWPQDWRDYISAVARQDLNSARAWAVKLQPLAPGCMFPPRVPLPPPRSK